MVELAARRKLRVGRLGTLRRKRVVRWAWSAIMGFPMVSTGLVPLVAERRGVSLCLLIATLYTKSRHS